MLVVLRVKELPPFLRGNFILANTLEDLKLVMGNLHSYEAPRNQVHRFDPLCYQKKNLLN